MAFQSEFERFHRNILLEDGEHYRPARQARDQVMSAFPSRRPNSDTRTTFQPHYWGSYAMGTGVRPLSGEYDIDIGLVFNTRPTDDSYYLKQSVFDTLRQAGYQTEWKRPCISVVFSNFHIDLSVCCYESDSRLYLAEGKQHDGQARWRPDGMEWFVERMKTHPNPSDNLQLRRLVRYLKRWKDIHFRYDGMKGPVGLALTQMAYHWFAPQPGDDLTALLVLVRQVVRHFQQGNTVLQFPYEPYDNLLRKLSRDQIRQLQSRFERLLGWLNDANNYGRPDQLYLAFGEDFG